MRLDAVIFGGGAAGLWLLDTLVSRGRSVVLLEASQLGAGQTISSQGIIHGGLKYTLGGLLTGSAAAIREMPLLWRSSLASERTPHLSHTSIRSEYCYLWQTESISSRLGMIGARFGLRVAAETVSDSERPEILAGCPGTVARMAEQVISPGSFLADLSGRHRRRILKIDAPDGLSFETSGPGEIGAVCLTDPKSGLRLRLEPEQVVFTAGAGNEKLRQQAGLNDPAMQRRPLHMVLVRGPLPPLYGHCVDGAKTRLTITSDIDSGGRTVWQLGGQIAEDGVSMDAGSLARRARTELESVLPGIDLSQAEWASYRIDRAEGRYKGGRRPEQIQMIHEGNTITAWPTKLALAPQLAEEIALLIATPLNAVHQHRITPDIPFPDDWPRPHVAQPPWETIEHWRSFGLGDETRKKAA